MLSGDRATLGIGAAWYNREHHGLGAAREADRPGRPAHAPSYGWPRPAWTGASHGQRLGGRFPGHAALQIRHLADRGHTRIALTLPDRPSPLVDPPRFRPAGGDQTGAAADTGLRPAPPGAAVGGAVRDFLAEHLHVIAVIAVPAFDDAIARARSPPCATSTSPRRCGPGLRPLSGGRMRHMAHPTMRD